MMKPGTNGLERSRKPRQVHEGPNWVFIVGGAVLSTLSIRIGWKLKQFLGRQKQLDNSRDSLTGNGTSGSKKISGACPLQRRINISLDGSDCCNCCAGSMDSKRETSSSTLAEESALPLAIIPKGESSNDNHGAMWTSSAETLELPRKPFHHTNSSESLRLSECGSDIYSKRDVIVKLRNQLKRRDEMIMEMQAQLRDLQNSLTAQMAHSTHLQSMLDLANKELVGFEREIQQMRKTIARHRVAEVTSPGNPTSLGWHLEMNGHSNGYLDSINALDLHCVDAEKGGRDRERVEMLKRELQELKEVIEGKEFLLQSYKEQKTELTAKVKELKQRLAYQALDIL